MRAMPMMVVLVLTLGIATWWTAGADQPPVPAAQPPRAEPPAFTPLKPFMAFSWHFPGHGLSQVKPMIWINLGANMRLTALAMRQLEPGTRMGLNNQTPLGMLSDPRDVSIDRQGQPTTQQSIWPDYGVDVVRNRWEEQLKEFAAADGEIDHLVLDYEENNSCWVMNEQRLVALGNDPRWPALARELGFADPLLALFGRHQNGSYLRWNAIQWQILNAALDRAMFAPLRTRFPKAGMSNYGAACQNLPHVTFDPNGHMQYTFGEVPGTHQAPAIYGQVNNFPNAPADFTVPFHVAIHAANTIRSCVRSSRTPLLPWVGFRSRQDMSAGIGGTDWWQELVYHTALSAGSDNLLFFNPGRARIGPADQNYARSSDNEAMNTVMLDLQKQAAGKRFVRPVIVENTPWDAKALVSGTLLEDGSTLARVTFRDGVTEAQVNIAGVPLKLQRPATQLGTWVHVPKF